MPSGAVAWRFNILRAKLVVSEGVALQRARLACGGAVARGVLDLMRCASLRPPPPPVELGSGTRSPMGRHGSQCMRTFFRDKAHSRPMGRSGVCGFHSLAFMVHAVRLALRRVRQGHQEMYEVRQHSLLVEPSPLDVLANIRQSIRHLGTGRANICSRHSRLRHATRRRSRRGTRYRR